jgi:hypothetical protein
MGTARPAIDARCGVCSPVLIVPRGRRRRRIHAAEPMNWADRLETAIVVLSDGRRVSLRHAVPSDAPRLTLLGIDYELGDGRVAVDDHGMIVAYAAGGRRVAVTADWVDSGLDVLLDDPGWEA